MLNLNEIKCSQIKCAGLGEILFDVYDNNPCLGGAPANFAYHCQRQGFKSIIISAVGHDDYADLASFCLAQKFLPGYLPRVDKQTGYVEVKLDAEAKANYEFADDTAYDNIPLDDKLLSLAKNINVVCFGSLAQRCSVSRRTIENFLDAMPKESIKIFDINLRKNFYNKEIVLSSLQRADIFKCNEDEIDTICDYLEVKHEPQALFNKIRAMGCCCFIYTQGGNSSEIFFNDEYSSILTPKIEVKDTVGAGDSFTAAFVCQLLKGKGVKEAHKIAVKVAAFVCTQEGAMPEYDMTLL